MTNRRRGAVAEALALLQPALPETAGSHAPAALIEPACGLRPAHPDLLAPVLDLLDHAGFTQVFLPSNRVSTRAWNHYQNCAWGRPAALSSHLEQPDHAPVLGIGLIAAWGFGPWRLHTLPTLHQIWIIDGFSPWGRSGWPAGRGLVIAGHSLEAVQCAWRWVRSRGRAHQDPRTLGWNLVGDRPPWALDHQNSPPTSSRPAPRPHLPIPAGQHSPAQQGSQP